VNAWQVTIPSWYSIPLQKKFRKSYQYLWADYRKPMDVLSVVDVCVKGKNMVVKKNSKKKTDVAKEENGERLIK
jgi:hypothetical protein